MQQAVQGSLLLAPAITGLLVGWLGSNACFGVDLASFLLSASLVFSVTIDRARATQANTSAFRSMADGLRFIFTHAQLTLVILSMAAGMFAMRLFGSLFSVYVRDILHSSDVVFDVLNSLIGIGGMIAGAQCLPRFARVSAAHRVSYALGGMGLGVLFTTLFMSTVACAIGMIAMGFAAAFVMVSTQTLIQQETPHEMIGRVTSVLMALLSAAQIPALLAAGTGGPGTPASGHFTSPAAGGLILAGAAGYYKFTARPPTRRPQLPVPEKTSATRCYNPFVARVLMISSEAAPLAKTGGLADVVGSLPAALREYGDEAAVIIPRYGSIEHRDLLRIYDSIPVVLNAGRFDFSIYQKPAPFPFYLADCPALFGRTGIYSDGLGDYPDNHIRFAAFCRAALSVARSLFPADIIHGHDWQAGPAIAYLKTRFAADPSFIGTKALFTIHNLGYQGIYPRTAVDEVSFDRALYTPAVLEFFGNISYLKAGIVLADAINTVSPTYANEIQTPEYGFGMDGVLRTRSSVLTGIVNGADYEEWDPREIPIFPPPSPPRTSPANESAKRV